jgi:hypothetical protein
MLSRGEKSVAPAGIRTPDCRVRSLVTVPTALPRVKGRYKLMQTKLIKAYDKAPRNIAEDLNINSIKYSKIRSKMKQRALAY